MSLIDYIRDLFRVEAWRASKKPVRHYPRSVCLVCGGTFALTSKGAWRHKCAVSRPKSAA